MTRAFLSFLRGNVKAAFTYHPLFPIFGFLTLYEIYIYIFPDKLRLPRKMELIIIVCSFALLLFIWLIRIKSKSGG
ncbi:MAG: DUF2752 domain-containing protein [Clostridia bacterium]|nr:DUF2752 domain-containing protein [Clostridia bacterium]